jgi:murein DD-endopeptidase MepM/ murein hydrolase activator NlpD
VPFKYRFSYQWTIGDYTAHHNCPENYRYPFGPKIRAFASVSDDKNATAYTRHAIIFSLPEETPVLAARKGTVIRITPGDKLDILHEDSTIGTYSHLEKIAGNIAVGNAVSTGDVLGIAARAENTKEAYLQLTVWRPEPLKNDELLTNARQTGFDAVSLPLAFSITDSDKGNVLTRSQPVSRVKLPASTKQTKRK